MLVTMKASGPLIERSTWVSAAKFTIASQPLIASATATGSSIAPATNRISSITPSRFSRRPAYVSLSSTVTSSPWSARRSRTNVEPMKPAPPQTSSLMLRASRRTCTRPVPHANRASRGTISPRSVASTLKAGRRAGLARAAVSHARNSHLRPVDATTSRASSYQEQEPAPAMCTIPSGSAVLRPGRRSPWARWPVKRGAADLVVDHLQLVALCGQAHDRGGKAMAPSPEQPGGPHDRVPAQGSAPQPRARRRASSSRTLETGDTGSDSTYGERLCRRTRSQSRSARSRLRRGAAAAATLPGARRR